MGNAIVDLASLVASTFGRSLYDEVRQMAGERGMTEGQILDHMRERLAAENEWRAERNIPLVRVPGI